MGPQDRGVSTYGIWRGGGKPPAVRPLGETRLSQRIQMLASSIQISKISWRAVASSKSPQKRQAGVVFLEIVPL
jgi:hypothetical protein